MEINYINTILNCELINIGRAADMCWIIFAPKDSNEEYSLHLQCPWRIRQKNKILLTNYDIYELAVENEDEDYEDYEWDDTKKNVFDEVILEYDKWKGRKVEKVVVTEEYDLNIFLSDGLVIECYVNKLRRECWRFFKRKLGEKHLVITGSGIEE